MDKGTQTPIGAEEVGRGGFVGADKESTVTVWTTAATAWGKERGTVNRMDLPARQFRVATHDFV